MKKLFFILALSLNVYHLQAQSSSTNPDGEQYYGNLSIASPNAYNLGTYGQIPVNLFSGLPNVDVPLYTLKYRDIQVPINLSYLYRGFRPNEHPSWVGLGWSLNAGGVITRVRKGEADEIMIPKTDGSGNLIAPTYEYSYIFSPSPSTYLANCCMTSGDLALFGQGFADLNLESINGVNSFTLYPPFFFDTEPDEFDFNFNGFSGKFYYNAVLKKWQLQSDGDNFTIQVTYGSSLVYSGTYTIPRYIQGFTLIAKDGTKYVFGGSFTDNNIEISYSIPSNSYGTANVFEEGNNLYTSSWYLSKIISPAGNEVDFKYANQGYSAEMIPLLQLQGYNNGTMSSPVYIKQTNYNTYAVSVARTDYLSEIDAGDYKVNFNSSATTYMYVDPTTYKDVFVQKQLDPVYVGKLDKNLLNSFNTAYDICIKDANLNNTFQSWWQELDNIQFYYQNNLFKEYDFSYNTMGPGGGSVTQRLELKSIANKGASGTTQPYYSFSYWDLLSGLSVEYGTRKVDEWGFYNGQDYFAGMDTNSITPTITNMSSLEANYDLTKMPDVTPGNVPVCVSGALKFITYPTGGTTRFDYEVNSYRKVPTYNEGSASISLQTNSSDNATGGIRVNKITNYPSTDPSNTSLNLGGVPVVKNYYYVSNYHTNGPTGPSSGILNTGIPKHIEVNDGSMDVFAYGGLPPNIFDPSYKLPFSSTTFYYPQYFYWSNNPIVPMGEDENNVGYSEVTEVNADGSYTVYDYSNYDNGTGNQYYDLKPTVLYSTFAINNTHTGTMNDLKDAARVSTFTERGKLLKESYYTNTNSLTRDISYTYSTDPNRLTTTGDNNISTIKRLGRLIPFSISGYEYFFIRSYSSIIFTYYNYLSQITQNDYYGSNTVTSYKMYTYDNARNMSSERISGSGGIDEQTNTFYCDIYTPPSSYTGGLQDCFKYFNDNNITDKVIEKTVHKVGSGGYDNIVSGTLYTYYPQNPISKGVYQLETKTPITNSSFSHPTTSGGTTFTFDSRYTQRLNISSFNTNNGNIQEMDEVSPNLFCDYSYYKDYLQNYTIAKVTNGDYNEGAFTSFEGTYDPTNLSEDNRNHWQFNSNYILSTDAVTGNKCYNLTSGSSISSQPNYLITTNKYTISLWAKPYTGSTGVNVSDGVSAITLTAGVTLPNGWTYYEGSFSVRSPTGAPTTNITISGSSYIDELRLYPMGAKTETYTYDPRFGMTSLCDDNSRITHYEYDEFGRLIIIRDQDGNIEKKYEYGLQQSE